MKKLNLLFALLLAAAAATPALAGKAITMKGSDTMVILGQRWAEKFMNANPGQIVMVTGGGSGTGIAALINGTTDICQSSRSMKQDEKLKLRDRFQTMGIEIPVAKDGLAVYVHESNGLKELTMEQLKGIYMGTFTNWKQVGGKDATIILYGRENSSGTYGFFKEHVLGGRDFSARVQTLPGTAAVVNAVSKDPNGIGYGGAAYAKGLRDVAMKKDAKSAAVLPTAANVHDNSYPLSRPLFFYLRKAPAGDTKKFVDWILSPDGQKLAVEVGYFPVK
ncbi:MAG: phosphate ABC transporter substrate-binding protein [Candidatus Eisenbacteria bacterium]|nr:phosphate ABC transporter substrate-binding protein [Candidatus Eisenbacteria bacterium]